MQENRKHMGKAKDDVIIPVAPSISEMEAGYDLFIVDVKESIRRERLKIVLNANSSMLMLYWSIGKKILEKQTNEGWGTKVIDRLSKDLKESFPEMKGFSSRNLKYMRKFAECWTDYEFVQRTVAQIPWRSNIVLMDKLKDTVGRVWYAEKVLEYGWSKEILDLQISTKLIERQGNAVSNFKSALGELVKNKTVLIIAHRMRTVLGADKIVVIKEGVITETGAPLELKEKQGVFSTMLKTQYQNS